MTEATAAPAAAPAPDAAPAAAAPAAAAPAAAWHGQTDPDAVAYIENKGWKTFGDTLNSYRNAEKAIGKNPDQLLVMPRPDDAAGMRALWQKLGTPEKPEGYEFPALPQGQQYDPAFQSWARDAFHKAGIPAGAAKTIVEQYNAFQAKAAETQMKEYEATVELDKKTLMSEWKGGYERMMNAAKNAVASLGIDADMLEAIEEKKGYAGTMKFFADLGLKMGESKFVGGDPDKPGAGFTPADAKAQWDAMLLDPNVKAALLDRSHPGHAAAQEKKHRLFQLMYGE